MAKLPVDKFTKGREGNLIFYPLGDAVILRTISGFTSEALKNSPQYENSRQTAREFGRVSSQCKQLRMALSGILPKQNTKPIMYALTKKLRQVLEHDTTNKRGERQLSNALQTEAGRQLLQGYDFNPDTIIKLECTLHNDSLTVTNKDTTVPKGIKGIGFRAHRLIFDYTTGESVLASGEWVFGNGAVDLAVPTLPEAIGVVFTILEAQFYDVVEGEFVAVKEDGGKRVLVVGIG